MNYPQNQNSSVRNRRLKSSTAKEIERLRREGERLYKSIKVKKKLLIILPVATAILACVFLGLCQPHGYTDMGILGLAIVFFIATFALGFYAYYWWNHKLGADPAYCTVEEFEKVYITVEMYGHMKDVQKDILQQYQEFLNEYHAGGNKMVSVQSGDGALAQWRIGDNVEDIGDLFIWKADRHLYIADSFSQHADKLLNKYIDSSYDISSIRDDEGNYDIDCFRLPIRNIKYYAKEGDVQYSTHVSGGGGGGFSMSGALVGGLIGGDVGAIIGSRKPVEEIRSYTDKHDTRKTILKYYNGREFVSQTYPATMYDALETIIPEKEFNVVQLDVASARSNQDISRDIKQRIQKLHELKEEGLITDEEYNIKRSELLTDI